MWYLKNIFKKYHYFLVLEFYYILVVKKVVFYPFVGQESNSKELLARQLLLTNKQQKTAEMIKMRHTKTNSCLWGNTTVLIRKNKRFDD